MPSHPHLSTPRTFSSRFLAAAIAVSATATLTAVALPASPAVAAAPYRGANTAAVQDDFNGDGYRDVAVGAPGAANGSVDGAGAVVVLYGSASGVSASHRTVITQATSGIPGTPEEFDAFGTAVTSADLDRDGYADLLIGTPSESAGTMWGVGSLTVVWGGSSGLKGGASISPPTGLDEGCGFAAGLAVGDVTGDGAADIGVTGYCGATTYTGPFTRTGAAAERHFVNDLGTNRGVVTGDVDGDGRAERFWLPGPTDGDISGPVFAEGHDGRFTELPLADGLSGQIGDINGDGYGDLVTGVPYDASLTSGDTPAHRGGEIQVLYGSAEGISPQQKPQIIHQDTAGVPGTGEDGDEFGMSLGVGDTNGDKYADVLVGAPGESVGSTKYAGGATLLRGSAAGLSTTGAVGYTQNTSGIPGTAESGDSFSASTYLVDLTKDGKAETVVGAPGENSDGLLWTARGSASGPVPSGSTSISGTAAGLTRKYTEIDFGAALPGARSTI
ncbi:FG-GAP-like repeat-containing protein [Streptomyces sp. VMFN-G11Ma]|uniref:FG-GAP-like repeat-containing protein n=1 Tax=Streptomyces sp. VMFN-G11Ma TaxID=2135609 RepID=UPI000D39C6A0|nr:FG-GAP-like repeat-containing protein [Streptomyces sp. VMFN-G11Ma]PTM89857.1 FG-GAP repeat protein [Streptomyces sp. VMFN-G11Ma]